MAIFVVFLVLTLLSRLLITEGTAQRKIYVLFVGSMLFLIAALRNDSVGVDVPGYIYKFKDIPDTNFVDLMAVEKDKGFYLFIKLLSLINASPRFYLIVIAAIYAISISTFIYRYSKEPAFSFFALLPLSLFYCSMTGLRQTVATAVVLFTYPYIIKKKPVHFFLVVLLAAVFHKSALVFSLAYIANYFKINYKSFGLLICCFLAAYLFRYSIVSLAILSAPERSYEITDAGGGVSTLIMYLGIFIFSVVFRKGIAEDARYFPMYFIMALGMLFQMMTPVLNEMFRIAMYFNIFAIVLLPNVIYEMKDRNLRFLCYMAAVYCLCFLYFRFTYSGAGVYPYSFIWDN